MRTALSIILLLALGAAADELPWRQFKSADGKQTFTGQLQGYKKSDESVTVRLKTTQKTTTFPLSRLSEDDRAYVKSEAANLAPNAAVELRFTKSMELAGSERGETTRVKNYNGGYKIELRNYSAEWIENIEAEYVIIHRKDDEKGTGERVFHAGSKKIASLLPNSTEVIEADGIEMENFKKEGKVEVRGYNRGSDGSLTTDYKVNPDEKRRDILLGCIVRIKVGDKVVHIDASSPDILRQYEGSFEELSKEAAAPRAKEK
jgi:hypothetical protein